MVIKRLLLVVLVVLLLVGSVSATNDLLLFVDGAELDGKLCSYSVAPQTLFLEGVTPVTTFVITNKEDFVLVPELSVVVVNGSVDGELFVTGGSVGAGAMESFLVYYKPRLLSTGGNFTGYVNVSIPECYGVGIPISGFIEPSGRVAGYIDFFSRDVLWGVGIGVVFLVWLLLSFAFLFVPFRSSMADNKPVRLVILLLSVLLLGVLFTLLTCWLVGGLT